MEDQLTAIADGPEQGDSSQTIVLEGETHSVLLADTDYDLTVHPAFASACTVAPRGGVKRDLYRQKEGREHIVHCPNGHPKKHVIKLKAKGEGNTRDITITISDPDHSIHSLQLQLYARGRKAGEPADTGDVFTVENNAKTCPPMCDT